MSEVIGRRLRSAALAANLIELLVFGILALPEWNNMQSMAQWLSISIVAVLVFNLYCLFSGHILAFSTWISLYFQRKAAEERAKIKALETKES
jgi:branched-subunit amino acid transport protein AzlD